jgi:hypothetical protein
MSIALESYSFTGTGDFKRKDAENAEGRMRPEKRVRGMFGRGMGKGVLSFIPRTDIPLTSTLLTATTQRRKDDFLGAIQTHRIISEGGAVHFAGLLCVFARTFGSPFWGASLGLTVSLPSIVPTSFALCVKSLC